MFFFQVDGHGAAVTAFESAAPVVGASIESTRYTGFGMGSTGISQIRSNGNIAALVFLFQIDAVTIVEYYVPLFCPDAEWVRIGMLITSIIGIQCTVREL